MSDGHAQALVDEGFDNTTFRDPATTADWNTTVTELLLPTTLNSPVNSLTGSLFGAAGTLVDVASTEETRAVAAGDMDGDGDLDLLFGNNGRNTIYFNNGFGVFTKGAVIPDDYTGFGNTRSAAVADFNGDGHLDVVFAEWGSGQSTRIHFNNGSGTNSVFTGGEFADLGAATLKGDSVATGDVDNDGDVDIVLGVDPGYVKLFKNDGFGNFDGGVDVADTAPANGFHARTVLLGDMDGDGDLDLVAARELDTTRIYLNNGSGAFDTGQSAAPGVNNVLPAPDSVSIGDVDGDGLLDIVVGNDASGSVLPGGPSAANYLLINSGNPASLFPSVTFMFANTDVTDSAHLLDVDKDGDLDLVTASFPTGNGTSTPGTNRLYLNDPVANTPNIFPANGTNITSDLTVSKSIVSGDFDGDRDLDLVFANQAGTTSTAQNRYVENIGTDSGVAADQLFATGLSLQVGAGMSLASGVFLDVLRTADVEADRIFEYWLSDDGGATWVNVHPERSVSFPSPVGNDLRWRVELNSRSPAVNPGLGRLVLRTNTAPQFDSTEVTSATQDVAYQYDIVASDQHDTILEIRATNGVLPAWLTLTDNGDGTATLAGTPTNADIGGSPQNDISLEVLDGAGLMDTQAFTIIVDDVNDAPTVVAATSDQVFDQGDMVSIDMSLAFDDPDGDPLTYSAMGLPASLAIDVNTGEISGELTNADVFAVPGGVYTVEVTAQDAEPLSAIDEFTLTVNNINDAPEFPNPPLTSATEATLYNYNVLVVDVDGDAVTITEGALPGWLSFTDNGDGTAALFGTPSGADIGSVDITLTASDGVASVDQAFTITVTAAAEGPVIMIIGDDPATVERGSSYTDQGATAMDPQDGDLTGAITTMSNVDTDVLGSYAVTYSVTDSGGNMAQAQRVVNVVDTTPPVITLLGNASVTLTVGSAYTDAGATASDETDGDITSDIVTDNPVNTNAAGTYTVTYNVMDSSGNAAVEVTRTVTVNAAPAPPPPTPSGGGGGGATSLPALLLLAGLAAGFRRRRRFDD